MLLCRWSFCSFRWSLVVDHISEVIGFLWYDNAWRYVSTISAEYLYHLLCLWCLVWCVTVAILLGMDVMECFLHTLRLHWVEPRQSTLNGSPRFNNLSIYLLFVYAGTVYTVNENTALIMIYMYI